MSEIEKLKEKRNAIVMAHNYQRPEIQDIADFIGDSLKLAQTAERTNADVLVFCGVDFMAETAAIINPEKKVLVPDPEASCPMANMLSVDDLLLAEKKFPDADIVLYINTKADVKAEADCVCTSANATRIVDSMESDTILFGPDKNLAYHVKIIGKSKKQIIQVPEHGLCPTHHQISGWDTVGAKRKHPDAKLVVHPECIPEVQEMADHIASTDGMIDYCMQSPDKEFIIGTENGILHRMRKEMPDKRFYPASETSICPNMKMHTLEKVRDVLENMNNEVTVPSKIANRARGAIDRMLEL
ncbi:MAG: quinolinate synthase, partial [Candidatus Altiarchaeales archaeon WOR_SM1_79]